MLFVRYFFEIDATGSLFRMLYARARSANLVKTDERNYTHMTSRSPMLVIKGISKGQTCTRFMLADRSGWTISRTIGQVIVNSHAISKEYPVDLIKALYLQLAI
jgi:hypothetical protein